MGSSCCTGASGASDDTLPPAAIFEPPNTPLRIVSIEVTTEAAERALKLRELVGSYPYVCTCLLHDARANWVARRGNLVDFYWRDGPTIHVFIRRRLPARGIVVKQTTVL